MAKTARSNVAATLAVATLAFVPGVRAAEPEATGPVVVIRVENSAEAQTSTLADAEQWVTGVYAAAGIRTVWVNGLADTEAPEAARHLTVVLLTRDMAEVKADTAQLPDGVMGSAVRGSDYAVVFYFRITDMVQQGRCYRGDALGKVLAHEVGHLLLPQPGHSARGIMQAHLDLRPGREAFFTDVQAEAMRGALRIRGN